MQLSMPATSKLDAMRPIQWLPIVNNEIIRLYRLQHSTIYQCT